MSENGDQVAIVSVERDEWYDGLSDAIAVNVRHQANVIKGKLDRTAQEIVEIGQGLTEVKASLPHGKWGEWLSLEFGMSDRTAQRFMNVAQRFGDKSVTVSGLSARVLYALAAPSTPDAVVDAAMEQTAQGQPVGEGDVKEFKRADAELKTESALYTHDAGDVAQRAADNRQREQAMTQAASKPSLTPMLKPAPSPAPQSPDSSDDEPLPLICPVCESENLWITDPPNGRDKSYRVQCRDCYHRWPTQHKDAGLLSRRPAMRVEPPSPPKPEQTVIVASIRVQPGETLTERRCIVAIGEDGEIPHMVTTQYDGVLDVLASLLEERVGRASAEQTGEFIDVAVLEEAN